MARVFLRDALTHDDLAEVRASVPVERGDLVATEREFFRSEAVLVTQHGARAVPALARRLELHESA